MISDIHTEINEALAEFHMKTGKPATNIYLGHSQMERLMRWAKENQYISITDMRTGEHRPEVMGLPVFEVNDEHHCFVA